MAVKEEKIEVEGEVVEYDLQRGRITSRSKHVRPPSFPPQEPS